MNSDNENEFSRRDFLRLTGFSLVAGAVMVGCSRLPIDKAIPYLIQPEEITPGTAIWYATTCGACSAGCGMMVKNRDGRPVKLEGNPDHPMSQGGLCAIGQASILGLYDSYRLPLPLHQSVETSWVDIDGQVKSELKEIAATGGAIRLLTGTVTSPTTKALIDKFVGNFPNAKHIEYSPLSSSAILEAHQSTHGVRSLPRYNFDKADVIASFDADFLGTWISPVEYTADYASGRNLENGNPQSMSYHIQFESRLSITGSKADDRISIAPTDIGSILTDLASEIARRAGDIFETSGKHSHQVDDAVINKLADQLWNSRGNSLVVCSSQDVNIQKLCNYINHLLGNYGLTIDIAMPSFQREDNDKNLSEFLTDLDSGKVDAIIVSGANPVYDLPSGDQIATAMGKVPLSICLTERMTETAESARIVCPESHYLEAWSDCEAVDGTASIFQPVLNKFNDTRTLGECLASWTGTSMEMYNLIKDHWLSVIFPRSNGFNSFQSFWDKTVHDGFVSLPSNNDAQQSFDRSSVREVRSLNNPNASGFNLILYAKVSMMDGRTAYNPFMQELPDPISKATWDNYAVLSPNSARALNVKEGDIVRISTGSDTTVELPLFVQPGQHDQTVAVALGYGSIQSRRFNDVNPKWLEAESSVGEDGLVGKNVAPLLTLVDGSLQYNFSGAKVIPTGRRRKLALSQEHGDLNVRDKLVPSGGHAQPIVQQGTLQEFLKNPTSVVPHLKHDGDDLWADDHKYEGYHWGMAIDMNLCTGCGSCVVSCQIENNIPVVGRDEVRRNREMHWLRIDRYYSENESQVDVTFQPMMCQQCDHAPCETVCPVLATAHSSEGLNQQIYNRCVGTRYCANNCPYKVRRFNWFNYPHNDEKQKLMLNPDVTVRSRGIMEKCSFCVQRIQEAKIEAKRQGRKVADGDVQSACQQSCPAGAIVFGDMNDPDSRVATLMSSQRQYRVLEELNVRPSVGYLAVIRNRDEKKKSHEHG